MDAPPRPSPVLAADALLGMLIPLWQLVLTGTIVLFVILAGVRLARRGRSRMNSMLLLFGVALVGVTVLGMVALAL